MAAKTAAPAPVGKRKVGAARRAPGSARFQRVGFGILPKRTSCGAWSDGASVVLSTREEVREGGTPPPTRWKRALPGVRCGDFLCDIPGFRATHAGVKTSACVIEYRELEGRILAALRADLREEEFAALALEAHAFQKRRNAPYAKFCATRPPAAHWREIPAVPQSAFKTAELRGFPEEEIERTFLTSGTTGEARGRHHFCSLALYHGAVARGWEFFGLPRLRILALTPKPWEARHSSLAEMLTALPEPSQFFVSSDGKLCTAEIAQRLHWQTDSREPALVFGTALAFLNFFEHCDGEGWRFQMPAGSAALETGGYKGSGREVPKAELYARFGEYLGLAPDDVLNEYGMTELSSQFYTRGLGGMHEGPPWVRAVVNDPETGAEAAVGETGVLRIFDLANLGSVLAVETQDLAVRRERGFELLGRDPAALPRGCSRAADERMRG